MPNDSTGSSMFVGRFYEMDPEFDDVIFGCDLREGMVVLIEDVTFRGDPERMDQDRWERARCLDANRWATVASLTLIARDDCNDLAQFIAVYGDGTKAVRRYDASCAWYVKKASIPAAAT